MSSIPFKEDTNRRENGTSTTTTNPYAIICESKFLLYPKTGFWLKSLVVMSFYGIVGIFFSSYLWCTISWNVGSCYDRFDIKEGIVCIFQLGFPGKNHSVFF